MPEVNNMQRTEGDHSLPDHSSTRTHIFMKLWNFRQGLERGWGIGNSINVTKTENSTAELTRTGAHHENEVIPRALSNCSTANCELRKIFFDRFRWSVWVFKKPSLLASYIRNKTDMLRNRKYWIQCINYSPRALSTGVRSRPRALSTGVRSRPRALSTGVRSR